MEHVGTYEAKNRLSELLDKVERGEEIVITRNGIPVARLVKPQAELSAEAQERARKALQWFRDNRPKQTFTRQEIRSMIEEGRQ